MSRYAPRPGRGSASQQARRSPYCNAVRSTAGHPASTGAYGAARPTWTRCRCCPRACSAAAPHDCCRSSESPYRRTAARSRVIRRHPNQQLTPEARHRLRPLSWGPWASPPRRCGRWGGSPRLGGQQGRVGASKEKGRARAAVAGAAAGRAWTRARAPVHRAAESQTARRPKGGAAGRQGRTTGGSRIQATEPRGHRPVAIRPVGPRIQGDRAKRPLATCP